MVYPINYNPLHSPNSRRPQKYIHGHWFPSFATVGARHPHCWGIQLEMFLHWSSQDFLISLMSSNQNTEFYGSWMGLLWDFNGRLKGGLWYWMGHFTRFNEATKQTIYPCYGENMRIWWNIVAWVIFSTTSQDEYFFWSCFSLSPLQQIWPKSWTKISCLKGHAFIIVPLLHPTMKNLDSSPSHQICQS